MTTSVVTTMAGVYRQGTLTSTTQLVEINRAIIPLTCVINTVDAGKLIEISVDGGTLFYTAPYTTSNAGQLLAVINYTVTHIRFTGAIGNTWRIQ